MSEWLEVGTDNYVLVTEGALLNTGLIVGSHRAMVIDTGCGPRQGRTILDCVKEKTELPLVVVNTHAHYDHFFGNAVFAEYGVTEFWGTRIALRRLNSGAICSAGMWQHWSLKCPAVRGPARNSWSQTPSSRTSPS